MESLERERIRAEFTAMMCRYQTIFSDMVFEEYDDKTYISVDALTKKMRVAFVEYFGVKGD